MASSICVARIDEQAGLVPDAVAFCNSEGQSITYRELKWQSDALACALAGDSDLPAGAPVVIYGHKSPLMVACFLACAKSGHAYVPVDTVYPIDRVASIVGQIGQTVVLDTTEGVIDWSQVPEAQHVRTLAQVEAAADEDILKSRYDALEPLGPDDTFYILFTSGSTGTPKGVQITTLYVDDFMDWLHDELDAPAGQERVWFNRAPFSFDVSVADIAAGMTVGERLFALEGAAETSLKATFEALATSGVTDWVSTPSFVDQCLADPQFTVELLPNLSRMLLAGEVLKPETVREAQRRFPGLRVFNGYGPTEAGFVTICEITPDMLEVDRSLPIGYAKPGIDLVVLNPETLEPVPNGTNGELFLVGRTVGLGYWKRPEQNAKGFESCPEQYRQGEGVRAYRTGDECTLEDDGLLYYHGRLDMQIKLHGFRIELGDIESVLCALPQVHMACVLPVVRNGSIARLAAVIMPAEGVQERGMALSKQLKEQAKRALPNYMIPSSFKYIDEMPLNANGKADRKALAALIGA